MALGIKGFRSRRRGSRQTADGTSEATIPSNSEKLPFSTRAQQWLSENPNSVRNGIFVILGITAVVILLVVLRAAAKDEHSRQLHAALEKYEQIKILPKGEARSLQMKEFGLSLKSTCEQGISTIESSAACFTAAGALLEGKDYTGAAALFQRAAQGYGSDAMGSVSRFMYAQALESGKQFEKALAVYKDLEKEYAAVKKSEMAVFHQGRMFYYMGKYDEAEERFAKLSRDAEGKEFAAASRNYISLLNSERAQAAKAQPVPAPPAPKK